jgi:hypothetical protein
LQPLHIIGSSTYTNFRIQYSNTSQLIDIGAQAGDSFYFYGYTDIPLRFAANSTNVMWVTANGTAGSGDGKVGIRTSSPGAYLHVNGSGTAAGTKICRVTQGAGTGQQVTDGFFDPFCINSSDNNLTMGFGVDTTVNRAGYINVAENGSVRNLHLLPRGGNVYTPGFVGIGTTSPLAPLHVNNNARVDPGNVGYTWFSVSNTSTLSYSAPPANAADNDVSIYTSKRVLSTAFIAYSDIRIKDNIVDIDDGNALSVLRQIQPKTYGYIDKFQKGNQNVIGFIAQDVKAVLPKAVSIIKYTIPNFYTLCQISSTDASNIMLLTSPIDLSWNALHDACGNVCVDTNRNASSDASGNKHFKIRLYDKDNNEMDVMTVNIVDTKNVLIDITDKNISQGTYFLYGQEVDNFHSLDKMAIFTVATAALQEVDRKQQADANQLQAQSLQIQEQAVQIQTQAERISTLETQNTSLSNTVVSLTQQNSDLQSQLALLQADVMKIKKLFNL